MRYRAQFPRDRATEPIGDVGFIGVNSRLEPHQLPPGYVSGAINMRFNRGIAETRLGMMFLPWLNKITLGTISITSLTRSGTTATATTASNHGLATDSIARISGAVETDYNGAFVVTVTGATTFTYTVSGSPSTPATGTIVLNTYTISPWGTVYGIGIFNDPRKFQDYLVIAADGNVYFTQVNNSAQAMTLPDGVTITDDVTFTQAFDTLIMFRGYDEDQIQTIGIEQAWTGIIQSVAGTGTQPIPRSERASFFQNRLFIPTGADEIAVSDFGDYTRYRPVAQELTINQGSSDAIVNIAKFNDVTLVIFKDRSIYALTDIYGDLTDARLDLLTDQFGLLAADSVAHCGADLLFLSQHGVMSIRQTEQNKLQSVVLPLSEAIQTTIDRINWKYAGNAVAAYWNNRYYLAVPLDDAEEFGHELVQSQVNFGDPANTVTVPVTSGATYRWVMGATAISLTNGSTTYTYGVDFVAAGSTVTITGTAGELVQDSLRRVYTGINNAILVYDFLNGAWSGYDQADALMVKRLFKFPYLGRDRLFLVTEEGWIALYEEDFEDQLSVPTVEVQVTSVPTVGNIVQVNTGTPISAINAASNTATEWGAQNLAAAQQNIFRIVDADISNPHGYNQLLSGTSWTAPNTYATQESGTGSVTFHSTNGQMPVVRISGSWATLTYTATAQITGTLITRGYASPEGNLSDFRWLSLDLKTWNPSYTVNLITDGVEESFNQCTARTKDRTEWYKPFDKAVFDVNNGDGRFMDKWREDYSLALGPTSPDASAFDIDATSSGCAIDKHQETRETFRVLPTGRSCRVEIVNSQGRIRLAGITIHAQKELEKATTQA